MASGGHQRGPSVPVWLGGATTLSAKTILGFRSQSGREWDQPFFPEIRRSEDPENTSNRRVSVIVQSLKGAAAKEGAEPEKAGPEKKHGH